MGNALTDAVSALGQSVSNTILDAILQWAYQVIYSAIADFFAIMGNMGSAVFDLGWVQATVRLFTLLGWALFIAGIVVAVFDIAVDYQNGGANIKSTCLNILMGFMACSLLGVVPIRLYKFCITLQHTFSRDIAAIVAGAQSLDLPLQSTSVLTGSFLLANDISANAFDLFLMIAFAYCIIKIFFQNIKRGGILLAQIAVGSLHMFSIPRGHTNGFYQWLRQVIALCLTAFLQTTLLYLGLLTFETNMVLGLGIMLAAGEVPKIAQQFGLDTSARFNMSTVVHTASTAVSVSRLIASAK